MQAPLKKVHEPVSNELDPEQVNEQFSDVIVEGEAPASGSAFVKPHSFGGASLVKDAREAAFKVRSLLG